MFDNYGSDKMLSSAGDNPIFLLIKHLKLYEEKTLITTVKTITTVSN